MAKIDNPDTKREINFRKAKLLATCGEINQFPQPDLAKAEIVLVGKSNVGKSTLINSLTGSRKLAYTSNTPGKTRLVIFFEIDDLLRLVDLPGYGFAQAAQAAQEKFSSLADHYLSSGRPLKEILILLDCRHLPGENDWQMMDWLEASSYPWTIVLTKADKLSKAKINQQQKEISERIIARYPGKEGIKILFVSAEKGIKIRELRNYLAAMVGAKAKRTD